MSPPAPPSSLPSTVGPGQVRPRGPGLCPHPPPAPQQPGAPHPLALSLGPGLGCRAWPRQHRPQLGTVPVLHHLSWPCIHPVPYSGVFDGSGAPGAHWPCTGSHVPCPRWAAAAGGVMQVPWHGQHVGSLGCHCSGWAGRGRSGCALSLAHGTASPCPCRPRHLPGLCLCPWLGPLCPGSPPPPEGLSAFTRALQQQ